jgi:hypothetical protein
MRRLIRYSCLIVLLFPARFALSQVEVREDLIPDTELLVYKQYSLFGQVHGNGFGAGYRYGKIKSITKYNFQEFEFLQLKHPKAMKRLGDFTISNVTSRRYSYGVLNQLFAFRYGLGTQRTLSEKPYWGGLQVDYTASFGAVLGLAIPQYLRILHWKRDTVWQSENTYVIINREPYTEVEKYDPNRHNNPYDIIGMGPVFKGLLNLRPYPGIYGRFGFNFDFGKYQERVNAVEVGVMIDVFPIPVPMVAHLPKNFFFANFYIAWHFYGERK